MKQLGYESDEYIPDEENPRFIFSLTHTSLLLDIAEGKIDSVELAKREIAARGLDKDGKWIGFDQAEKFWNI